MNEVLMYGQIYSFTAKEFVESFANITGDTLTLRINSNGGSVTDGWAMIAKFSEFEGSKKVKIDGCAYSMAAAAPLYADEVECLDVSRFMFHRASYGLYYETEYMTESEKVNLDAINKNLRAAFEAKIDVQKFENLKSVKDKGYTVNRLFSNDERIDIFLTAQEAKQIGLVDRIIKITPQKATAVNKLVADLSGVAASTELENLFVKVPETPQSVVPKNVNTNTMNRVELKEKHPELYAEIVADTAATTLAAERDRVGAHLVYIGVDPKAVVEGIKSGGNLTQTAMAELAFKLHSKEKVAELEAEGEKTPGAELGAGAPPKEDKEPTASEEFEAKLAEKLGINKKG